LMTLEDTVNSYNPLCSWHFVNDYL
jgi:hypothetical protein